MITLSAFCIVVSCSFLGLFLNLKKMSLVGDAVSHSLLPGLALAFWWWGRDNAFALMAAACATSVVLLLTLSWMSQQTRVKDDSIQTILYTSFFALGVLIVGLASSNLDIDADCVLFGELAFLPLRPKIELFGFLIPRVSFILALITLITFLAVFLFHRELRLCIFDEEFARVQGRRVSWVRFLLLLWLSVVVSVSFEAVGAILVVGMIILPGATLLTFTLSLGPLLVLLVIYSLIVSVLGVELAFAFDLNIGATIVVLCFSIFLLRIFFRQKHLTTKKPTGL